MKGLNEDNILILADGRRLGHDEYGDWDGFFHGAYSNYFVKAKTQGQTTEKPARNQREITEKYQLFRIT